MDRIRRVKLYFAVLMILTGILVFSYPFLSQTLAKQHATEVVEAYVEDVKEMDQEKIDAIREAAREYNDQLSAVKEANAAGEGERRNSYLDLIDVGSALGYITIPKIDVNLPIYEGTSDAVLSRGIGHLTESSYPIGGAGTHSALSGHRGMAEQELFTNLDRVETGNKFYLHILDEVLAYQVDQVKVVEPDDISDLTVIAGEDLCTLITCTPIGINSHRLLVRGHRVPYTGEDEESKDTLYQSVHTGTAIRRMTQIWPWMLLVLLLMLGAEAGMMAAVLRGLKNRMEDD